jgi:exopolyphosphatase / guanosine-5'-triphosphate,3'-diphosphate pyrophosphatase
VIGAARRADPVVPISTGAAVDVGSNSVHLLVAVAGPGFLQPLRDTSDLLGLGDVVDEHGSIPKRARKAVVDVLRDYVETAYRSRAERVTLVATDPLRRASNAGVLIDDVRDAMGLALEVLTEEDEALLNFIGVTRGQPPAEHVVVVDIGGGSTDVATWSPQSGLRTASIGVGSGRLTNAIVEHDPPTDAEFSELLRQAREAVDSADLAGAGDVAAGPRARYQRAIFVGGTATNIARLGRLTRRALADDQRTLSRLKQAQVSARFRVRPRRAQQLPAGVAIVAALLDRFGLDAADVSDASLRDGAIIAAATFGDDWRARLGELARAGVAV